MGLRTGSSSFSGCSSLIEIIIPSSVTSIGDFAFSGCSSLKRTTFPSSVTSIGNDAFEEHSSLKQIFCPLKLDQRQIGVPKYTYIKNI